MYVICVCGTYEIEKGWCVPQEVELQIDVSHHVSADPSSF